MMTPDEVIDLLTLAAAYDRRTVGQADIEAWMDAARRAHWTAAEAHEAVKTHYAHAVQFVMPGHVTDLIRAERRKQASSHDVLGPAAPASPETRERMRAIIGKHFALPKDVRKARGGDQDGR